MTMNQELSVSDVKLQYARQTLIERLLTLWRVFLYTVTGKGKYLDATEFQVTHIGIDDSGDFSMSYIIRKPNDRHWVQMEYSSKDQRLNEYRNGMLIGVVVNPAVLQFYQAHAKRYRVGNEELTVYIQDGFVSVRDALGKEYYPV